MNIVLTRDLDHDQCTLGILRLAEHFWQTLERPWSADPAGNPGGHPETSCVPPGIYRLLPHDTLRHPRTWCLVSHELGVYAGPTHGMRDSILIHPANVAHEIRGCIAIGKGRQWLGEEWAVTQSRIAFGELQQALPWTEHTIEISGGI